MADDNDSANDTCNSAGAVMKKGDKLRVIVSKGDRALCGAPLRKGQIVIFSRDRGVFNIEVEGWFIFREAVEAV